MSTEAIQKIICKAVVSDEFRSLLLGPNRAELLRDSGLEDPELEALAEIRAETIDEFAAGVERWMRMSRREANRVLPEKSLAVRKMIRMEAPPDGPG
jgi:hypothetical protein